MGADAGHSFSVGFAQVRFRVTARKNVAKPGSGQRAMAIQPTMLAGPLEDLPCEAALYSAHRHVNLAAGAATDWRRATRYLDLSLLPAALRPPAPASEPNQRRPT
jgi:hypothetical protein